MTGGVGSHERHGRGRIEWLTPPQLIESLGEFDLDPCAAVGQPWRTAHRHYTVADDGLVQPWEGRVWLNPPYDHHARKWLERLSEHGNGIALIFARTETRTFFDTVWTRAHALLFLRGRLYFHRVDGSRPNMNCGAPSVLVAYGSNNREALLRVKDTGAFIDLEVQHATQRTDRPHSAPPL